MGTTLQIVPQVFKLSSNSPLLLNTYSFGVAVFFLDAFSLGTDEMEDGILVGMLVLGGVGACGGCCPIICGAVGPLLGLGPFANGSAGSTLAWGHILVFGR